LANPENYTAYKPKYRARTRKRADSGKSRHTRSSIAETAPPDRDAILNDYLDLISPLSSTEAEALSFGVNGLKSALRSNTPYAPGMAAAAAVCDHWFFKNVGRVDDQVRRAATATLALCLSLEDLSLPVCVLDLYPDLHRAVTHRLKARAPYDVLDFAADILFAAGMTSPIWSSPQSRRLRGGPGLADAGRV
jgi:hypothetical protein